MNDLKKNMNSTEDVKNQIFFQVWGNISFFIIE